MNGMIQPNHAAQSPVIAVGNFDGIYCDGWVLSGNMLCFVSLWGRPSRVMALYGSVTEQYTTGLELNGRMCGISHEINKRQTRLPATSRYGNDMMHVMLYVDAVLTEKAGIRVLLDRESVNEDRLWMVLSEMSELALLPHWRKPLLKALRDNGFIADLEGFAASGVRIDLFKKDDYQALVQSMVRGGQLTREAVV